MQLHKNVTFWNRFLTVLIDLFCFALATILQYYFLVVKSNNLNPNIYIFMILSILSGLVLFVALPFCLNGRTIGMLVCRSQIINEKDTYTSLASIILKKSIFNIGLWLILCLLFISLIYPQDFQQFKQYTSNPQDTKDVNFRFVLVLRLISTFVSLIFMIGTINLIMVLVKKNKRGFIDIFTNSRMVYLKHYSTTQLTKTIKLVPYRIKNQPVNFIN